ncbi:MAG TPA: hypothetical protein V6C81_08660 [Planktothrix sp.]|jgi:hypothetical protein
MVVISREDTVDLSPIGRLCWLQPPENQEMSEISRPGDLSSAMPDGVDALMSRDVWAPPRNDNSILIAQERAPRTQSEATSAGQGATSDGHAYEAALAGTAQDAPSAGRANEATIAGTANELSESRFDDLSYRMMDEFGIKIERGDGRMTYHYVDSNRVLYSTVDGLAGIDQARDHFKAETSRLKKEIEGKYAVSFSSGSDTIHQTESSDKCLSKPGKLVTAREPRLVELAAIDAALAHWVPVNPADNRPFKFYFLNDSLSSKLGGSAHYIDNDGAGNRAIAVDVGASNGAAPLYSDEGFTSLESLFDHELAHASQHNLGAGGFGSRAQYAKKLGWTSYFDKTTDSTRWILKGKDDRYYSSVHGCGFVFSWTRVNRNGVPIDANHKVLPRSSAETVSTEGVAQQASVKPISDYFYQPNEESADALMYFRLNAATRSQLLRTSPKLYKVIKQMDQKELDILAPPKLGKAHQLIRQFDGTAVPFNSGVQKKIESEEREAAGPEHR